MKNVFSMLTGGLILAGLLLAYVASSLHHPYYLLWDGDFVPVLDTLLVAGGNLPAHVHYPALGVYLILSPVSWIGHLTGWISIRTMSDLFAALPLKKFVFYEKDAVRKVHNYPEKFRLPEDPNALSLLIRADMDSYVFVDKADLDAVMTAINDYRWPIGVDSGKTIEVTNGQEHQMLYGILLQNYAELPLKALRHPFTLVLVRRYGGVANTLSITPPQTQ